MSTECLQCSVLQGATAIRDFLLKKYGEYSFSVLVDEGGRSDIYLTLSALLEFCLGGYSEKYGAFVSTPAVAEKGHLDVKIQISTPGGHSSVPPKHTVSA